MKIDAQIEHGYNTEIHCQVYKTLLEAAKAYKKARLEDNLDFEDEDVSVAIVKINDTEDYLFVVSQENEDTNCGSLSDILSGETTEEELINVFESENWLQCCDADEIDVDLEKETVFECKNSRGSFYFIDNGYYTFSDNPQDIKTILKEGACYDDKLTLQDIYHLERYNYVEVNKDRVKKVIEDMCSDLEDLE